jgi:aryl-alcohol dehydrogenase-like predicted oxidoreductase
VYGENEVLLAKLLAQHKREDIFLATKFGAMVLHEKERFGSCPGLFSRILIVSGFGRTIICIFFGIVVLFFS